MRDRIIFCFQCEKQFIFTVKERQHYDAHGFDYPKRCPECRKHKQKINDKIEKEKKKGRKHGGRRENGSGYDEM
ncbi:MAG: zinc-ribbon domain containing protein [Pseudomonadota bacterium]